MTDLKKLHAVALDAVDDVVGTVTSADLGRRTPCAGWDLGALLAHMVGQHRGFAAAARDGDAPVSEYAPVPFTAPTWSESVSQLRAAFDGLDTAGTTRLAEIAPDPLPNEFVLGAQLLDTAIHTWDVACGLGRSFTPRADIAATVLDIARQLPDSSRGPDGAFAAVPPGEAGGWHEALRLTGRDPDRA